MGISEIDPAAVRARKVRKILGRCVRSSLESNGDDLAGFSLVSWDMRGNANSSYFSDIGPVGESLVPSFTKDALNRHIAVVLVERTSSTRIDDN